MKKVILSAAVLASLAFSNNAKAQLVDEQNVTVTMDLQPILQLGMNGSTNIDFVFDQISEYVGGITQYGATNLTVSSSVSWDLFAAGFSSQAAQGTGLLWDNQVVYGGDTDPNSVTTLPLTLLELHQDKVNPSKAGAAAVIDGDYFQTLNSTRGTTTIGNNNVYATTAPYSRPTAAAKYIAGHSATSDFVVGGSYLILVGTNVGQNSSYSYTMDYRIVPGLPAVFPNASSALVAGTDGGNNNNNGALNAGTATSLYAQPGVYTMNVKYVLIEN